MPDLSKLTAAQLRAWLKSRGHDAGKVDAVKLTTAKDRKGALLTLHGVTEQEYRAASH